MCDDAGKAAPPKREKVAMQGHVKVIFLLYFAGRFFVYNITFCYFTGSFVWPGIAERVSFFGPSIFFWP